MHVSETQRALLLPQEVIQLPRDEQIILVESFAPIKCKKIFYFKDRTFTKRLMKPIVLPVQEPYDPRKNKKKVAAAPPPPAPSGNSAPPAAPPASTGDNSTPPATAA